MKTVFSEILEELKKPLSYKWKPQSQSKDKTKRQCVAYIDSRDVQRILDETCIWQNEFYEVKGKLFCRIGIWNDDLKMFLWKSDSGFLENDNIEDGTESKGEVSDTFKRCAVQWGIGRFLYDKEIRWITNEEFQANKYKLTEFINGNGSKKQTPTSSTIYIMTTKDVENWNGKIYGKSVYINEEKKTISDEQITKLKAHPKYGITT